MRQEVPCEALSSCRSGSIGLGVEALGRGVLAGGGATCSETLVKGRAASWVSNGSAWCETGRGSGVDGALRALGQAEIVDVEPVSALLLMPPEKLLQQEPSEAPSAGTWLLSVTSHPVGVDAEHGNVPARVGSCFRG